jgi:hypothetical protein
MKVIRPPRDLVSSSKSATAEVMKRNHLMLANVLLAFSLFHHSSLLSLKYQTVFSSKNFSAATKLNPQLDLNIRAINVHHKPSVHTEVIRSGVVVSNIMAVMPASVPTAPATMQLGSRPNQAEANDEIYSWLASGLQSYVEEGQRMRDAANGIHLPERSRTGTASRCEDNQRTFLPRSHPNNTQVLRTEHTGDVPPRQHVPMNISSIVRQITINGDSHHIHLNTGSGQQNVYHYTNGDDDHCGRRNHGNGWAHCPGYRQPGRDRNGQDNGRDDDRYRVRGDGDMDSLLSEYLDCQPDMRCDIEDGYDGYDDDGGW